MLHVSDGLTRWIDGITGTLESWNNGFMWHVCAGSCYGVLWGQRGPHFLAPSSQRPCSRIHPKTWRPSSGSRAVRILLPGPPCHRVWEFPGEKGFSPSHHYISSASQCSSGGTWSMRFFAWCATTDAPCEQTFFLRSAVQTARRNACHIIMRGYSKRRFHRSYRLP